MKSQMVTMNYRTFVDQENGGMSIMNLFFLMAVGMLAGVAIDVSSLVSARSQLQVTADAAAHAALVEREWSDLEISKAKAVSLVEANMPSARYGTVLTDENIQFGSYDRATEVFTIDDDSRDAVFVRTERLTSNGNPVSSFLLQFVGFWDWDVRTTSVFETFYPTCMMEGFVGQDVVDIQSNNSYFNGFCIHSNAHVEINQNNFFEAGTIVSMPDTDDLVVPTNGNAEESNEGLEDALREGRWFIKILDRLDRIVEGVQDEDSRYAQLYTTNFTVVNMTKTTVSPSDFTKGRIYHFPCNNRLTFGAGIYEEIVVISECKLKFTSAEFHDSVIITKDTGLKSVSASANIIMGKNDDCNSGGGSQLISYGTVDFAASLEMHGSQIIAAGDVAFTANAEGIRGASIVAGGRIDGTSNMNFAFCGSGMEHVFSAEYFRMAG